jgi:hypothetical protein
VVQAGSDNQGKEALSLEAVGRPQKARDNRHFPAVRH